MCKKSVSGQPTLGLDDRLDKPAKRLGKHGSKRAGVNEALAEHVASRKRRRVLDLFGNAAWDSKYDYKAVRQA
ncbi:MAG: type II toxin-antitoxin system VapB family antitoxin [Gemmatimonadales bacterium]